MTVSERIYLDHAATTPLLGEVRDAMAPGLGEVFANPNSIHSEGTRARAALEEARDRLQRAVGAFDFDVVFTSGGTEADNLAVLGPLLATGSGEGARRVLASAMEHPAVRGLETLCVRLGFEWEELGVDPEGRVDPTRLRERAEGATLVSVVAASNETGVLQDIDACGDAARAVGALLHCDAVQLLGKVPVRFDDRPVDLVALSAHKIGGPKGIGALLVRRGVAIEPWSRGGGQEGGLRSGTQAVALAVGFARAAEIAVETGVEASARVERLRERLRSRLLEGISGVRVHTPARGVAPHVLSVSFTGVEGESLTRLLDDAGVAVSTGSACSAGSRKLSHALLAMGCTREEVRGSIRFSLGPETSVLEIDAALERTARCVERLRAIAGTSPVP